MNCYQTHTENYQRKSNSNHWMILQDLYLLNHQSNEYKESYKSLSRTDKDRLGWVSFMEQHQQAGRTLFHLTLTYKPYADREYKEIDVNNYFKNFYVQSFLPYLLGTKHFNRPCLREFQPICLSFVDGIAPEPSQKTLRTKKSKELMIPSRLPAHLHHHAVLAVHEYTLFNLMQLVGKNTFANSFFGYKIMTSDLKQCDATRLLYSSKSLKQFPDFMSFPDRIK